MIKKLEKLTNNNLFWLVLVIFISVPASIPLFRPLFYHFSDESHLANLYEMVRAFSSGQIPPRMAPDISFGFGYPLFNFYYPLPYYFGSLFYFLTKSLVLSIKLLFLFSIFLSGLFMFIWLKNHTTKLGALVGTIIYIYTPYRAVDLYVRGALGEAISFVFFPLIFFTLDGAIKKTGSKNIGLLAVFIGLFILSHNLSPLFAIPFFILYVVISLGLKSQIKSLAKILLGFVLGFLISSFWSVPAFLEKSYLQNNTPFNYVDHFPFVRQLIYSKWGYGSSVWGPGDELSFQIGVVNILLVFLVILSFWLKKVEKKQNHLLFLFLGTFFFTTFLMNIRSKFLWELFPLANYIQFPWRLLMFTTLLTAFMVVFIKNAKLLIFLGILAFFLNFHYFKPSEYFKPNDNYYLKRFFADRLVDEKTKEVSKDYLNYSEDYILLPKWIKEKPQFLPESRIESKNVSINNLEEINPVYYSADLDSYSNGEVIINFFYFPGWSVFLNDKELRTEILSPYGNFKVEVPEGKFKLKVIWRETTFRKIFDIISLISLLMAGFLIKSGERSHEKYKIA